MTDRAALREKVRDIVARMLTENRHVEPTVTDILALVEPLVGERHPWERFLTARLAAIQWMQEQKRDDAYIVWALSVDLQQVQLLKVTLDDRRRALAQERG